MTTKRVTSKRVLALTLAGMLAAFALLLSGCVSKSDPEPQEETPALEVTSDQASEVRYIFLLGDDSWEDHTPGNGDLNMLMRVDSEAGVVSLLTIPRDTAIMTDGYPRAFDNIYREEGIEGSLQLLSETVGMDVTDYIIIGFDGLQNIVEYFGGLDVNLPYALNYNFYTKDYPDEYYEAGEQTLTPWRAMALSRARTGYSKYNLNEDMMRQVVDRQMTVNLAQLLFSNPENTLSILSELSGNITTNLSADDISKMAQGLLQHESITFYTSSGPYEGGIEETSGLYVVDHDPVAWENLMAAFTAGEDMGAATEAFAAASQSSIAPINQQYEVSVG